MIDNPVLNILFLAFFVSLVVSLYQRKIFSKSKINKIKTEIDEIRKKLLKSEADEFLVKKVVELNKIFVKENMKVLVVALLIGLLGIYLVQHAYSGYTVKLPIPVFKNLNILYFYIILTFVIGIVLSKLLEVS